MVLIRLAPGALSPHTDRVARLPDRAVQRCGFRRLGFRHWRLHRFICFHFGGHISPRHVHFLRHVHLARTTAGITPSTRAAGRGVSVTPEVRQASQRRPRRATGITAATRIAAVRRAVRPFAPVDFTATRSARQATLCALRQVAVATRARGAITARITGPDSRTANGRVSANATAETQHGRNNQQGGRIPI